jgi:hypothetical protein
MQQEFSGGEIDQEGGLGGEPLFGGNIFIHGWMDMHTESPTAPCCPPIPMERGDNRGGKYKIHIQRICLFAVSSAVLSVFRCPFFSLYALFGNNEEISIIIGLDKVNHIKTGMNLAFLTTRTHVL